MLYQRDLGASLNKFNDNDDDGDDDDKYEEEDDEDDGDDDDVNLQVPCALPQDGDEHREQLSLIFIMICIKIMMMAHILSINAITFDAMRIVVT